MKWSIINNSWWLTHDDSVIAILQARRTRNGTHSIVRGDKAQTYRDMTLLEAMVWLTVRGYPLPPDKWLDSVEP
jgi:hypothetical protein